MFEQTSQQLIDFIHSSPSCFHAVAQLSQQLKQAGFSPLQESHVWALQPGHGYYTTRNGSSLIAFRIPQHWSAGYAIAAAHSDSPTFRLKEHPCLEDTHYTRFNVEKYGGGILSTWLDRPLSVAGRIITEENGVLVSHLVDAGRDLVLIPNLAIHMNPQVNSGVPLNPQVDLLPLFGEANSSAQLMEALTASAKVEPQQVLSADLFLYLRESGRIWGAHREFLSSPRLDDLQCAWSAVQGLIAADTAEVLPVCAIFDNEEVGSATKQGADSTFLQDVLDRIRENLGLTREQQYAALASSFMVSADNGHAIHPNHPEKSDQSNFPVLNGGVVIKSSANQKYTTDAVSSGIFRYICKKANVPVQVFLNRSDMPGGSTLGNISNSHLSLNTVDIGLAQLAMHSSFETGGIKDTQYLLTALKTFFETAVRAEADGRYSLV